MAEQNSREPGLEELQHNPLYYRLSQELKGYGYPDFLGIRSVTLDEADVDCAVELQTDVIVTQRDTSYRLTVYTPGAFLWNLKRDVRRIATSSVAVSHMSGESIALAVVDSGRRGFEVPRNFEPLERLLDRELGEVGDELLDLGWLDPERRRGPKPSEKEIVDLLTQAAISNPKLLAAKVLALWPKRPPEPPERAALWDGVERAIKRAGCAEPRFRRFAFRLARCSSSLTRLELVQMLGEWRLPLGLKAHYDLADELLALRRRLGPCLTAWPIQAR